MPAFRCKLGTPEGDLVEEIFEGASEAVVRDDLAKRGFHVFSLREQGGTLSLWRGGGASTGRVKMQEFLIYNQQLIALLRAGLPIVQAFGILLERMPAGQFRHVLTSIKEEVTSGVAMSDAFAAQGDLFPKIYSTSLRAGERSGDLEGVLRRFLAYQRILIALKKKVTAALIYPAVLFALSFGLIVIMLTYVIPRFTEFYAGFEAKLPLPTRILVAVSLFAKQSFWFFLAGAILAFYLLARWMRTESGRLIRDRFILKIPVLGPIFLRFAISQFTKSLATLLGGGTPLVPAMEIAARSVGNSAMGSRIEGVVHNVREGEALSVALERIGLMTSLTLEMVKVGESTGALEDMLNDVSQFYDEEIDTNLQRVVTLVEPAMLVLMGGVIAALLIAVYLPLFSLVGKMS